MDITPDQIRTQSLPGWLPSLQVDLLRLDQLHPLLSGNKWFKLKHHVLAIQDKGKTIISSMGGGWSNHLHALAYTAHRYGLKSKGYIRGHYPLLTPTLLDCKAWGMELHFLSSQEYTQYREKPLISDKEYWIAEGGDDTLGLLGTIEIGKYIPKAYDYCCVSVGTGTTLTGLLLSKAQIKSYIGFAPMNGGTYLIPKIQSLLSSFADKHLPKWQLFDRWHEGGFGKMSPQTHALMIKMNRLYNVSWDKVYTAKMALGMEALSKEQYFEKDSRILCIHTGGLQGNRSLTESAATFPR